MSVKSNPQFEPDADVDHAINDAALCLRLANEIDNKEQHDGKRDSLTAYALRKLANHLMDYELNEIPTVSVRILVAIDETGAWVSCGSSRTIDPKNWIMLDDLGSDLAYRWIEADVPMPPVTPNQTGKVS